MKSTLSRHWPLVAAWVILWTTFSVLFHLCLKGNQGQFVYAIDDAYIHMAIAKNFAEHGVWGVTPFEFSSSSSSILWPLLLSSTYRIFGPSELAPLILNLVLASLTLYVLEMILNSLGMPRGYLFAVLLGVIFFTPLTALIFTGMEHGLQVLVTTPFVYLAAKEIAGEDGGPNRRDSLWLWVLTPLVTLTRYEGLFLVSAVCLLFAVRRRWRFALALGAVATAPAAIYGAISAVQGWFWLPNSVVLKGNVPRMFRAEGIAPSNYGSFVWSAKTADILYLVFALLFMFVLRLKSKGRIWEKSLVMVLIFFIATALHLKFAALGWFYRYEAYLIALGLFILATIASDFLSKVGPTRPDHKIMVEGLAALVLMFFSFPILSARGIASVILIPRASRNMFEQQYQIGLFLKQFYRGAPVAANDIGAVSFLGDTRLQDIQGLGSLEAAKERIRGPLHTDQIYQLAKSKDVKVAIVHARLFEHGPLAYGGVPPQWVKVGQWTITNNLACDDDTISFFAVDSSEEARLIANLKEFSSKLPSDIIQGGKYIE